MNAEHFSQYLQNQHQLFQMTYQELKSLVLQYPYCQNLRFLLARKSQMDNHAELDKNLKFAATYSIDRKFFYDLFQQNIEELPSTDSFVLKEDYLELKDLNKLESKTETIFIPSPEITEEENLIKNIPPIPTPIEEEIIEDQLIEKEIVENKIDLEEKHKDAESILLEHAAPTVIEEDAILEKIISDEIEEENIDSTPSDSILIDDFIIDQIIREDIPPQEALVINKQEDINLAYIPDEEETEKEKTSLSFIDQLRLGHHKILNTDEPQPNEDLISEHENITGSGVRDNEMNDEMKIDIPSSKSEIEYTEEEEIPKESEQMINIEDLIDQEEEHEDIDIPFEITNDTEHIDEEAESISEDVESIQPTPKTSFGSWIKQFQENISTDHSKNKNSNSEEKKKKNKKKKKKKRKNKEELAFSEEAINKLLRKKKKKKLSKKKKKKNVVEELLNETTTKDSKKKKKKKKNKSSKKQGKSKIRLSAEKSIQDSSHIASETLAAILIKQGSYKKAIEMYERLSLIFPEKSSFFADQIKNLKNL